MRSVAASSRAVTHLSSQSSTVPSIADRATWHSPLPYLFGGLAAMLSLIAFALVILACSYWNLSRRQRDHDLEAAADGIKADSEKSAKVNYDEKVLVIMAGNQNPTFLATPVSVKVSSAVGSAANGGAEEKETAENREKMNKDMEMNSHDREVSVEENTSVSQESGAGSQYQ